MERQLFYKILAYGLLAILVFDLGTIFLFLRSDGSTMFRIIPLKSLFALLIMVYETINSMRNIRRTNYYLFPMTIIGFLFIIAHWPYGRLLFLGSLLLILVLLFINAIKSNDSKKDKLLVLFFPFCHYIFIVSIIYQLPIVSVVTLFELVIIGIISLTTFYKQLKHKY